MKKWLMFSKLVGRSLWFRKWRSVVAVLIIVLGTGVIGGMVNVYFDMNQKMGKEFRNYGANLLLAPSDQQAGLQISDLPKITGMLPEGKTVGIAPLQYSSVFHDKNQLVLVGTWLDEMQRVSPYWKVDGGWITERGNTDAAMVGESIAKELDLKPGAKIELKAQQDAKPLQLRVAGIVSTGGVEDDQIFVDLKLADSLSQKGSFDLAMISLMENKDELAAESKQLQAAIPGIQVKPLEQMVQLEAGLLTKLEQLIYLVALVVFVTTVLSVLATFISMIMEKRKEIGLKKALGATDAKVMSELLAEGFMIGMLGSSFGIAFAYYLAQIIGEVVFDSDIAFRGMLIPWTYLGALLVIGFAFIFAMKRIVEVEPAVVLKGE